MKKALILFLIISNKVLFAQFGQITSVQIIPAPVFIFGTP
jgi:hypothetical protein